MDAVKSKVSSPFSADSPVHWLHWLLESERLLAALIPEDDYALYELMHHQAALLSQVDSCYVCLHRPRDNALFFTYNFDEDLYDEPLTIPMGNGPTSYVVREGKPLILNAETEAIHSANINFGNGSRISLSAVHLPLIAAKSGEETELLGVFSVQSYQPDVYSQTTIAALELWCNRVALHLLSRTQKRGQQEAAEKLQIQLREAQAHHIRIADHFVELLQPLTRQAQELSQTLKSEAPISRVHLKSQVEELCRSCYRAQTEASQLPLSSRSVLDSPHLKTSPKTSNPLDCLSEAEVQVLRLLATGATNPQIAQAIGRSVETAKKHCASIYGKLGARNRIEAARLYARHAATTKNTQSGNRNSP